MVIVGRAINGITLNGLEYLLDQDGKEMEFASEQDAKEFLTENGVSTAEIESFVFEQV